ncbi:MAG: DsbA family protein [Sulfurospirillaceae bacterium]|nr:DsbA family protein [Sulfurospirillaceae bacterium]MDD2825933.1 DsbA family protein [Sulfurospirillaceae bacterium]
MKSSMLKLLTITLLALSSTLLAAENTGDTDKKIVNYLEKAIATNDNYKLDKVVILKKDNLKEIQGWKVYFVRLDLVLLKQGNKKVSVNDVLFTDGTIMSKDLLALENGRSIKNNLSLDLDSTAYNKEHLLAGNLDAPNKIVVFSDPLCPFCMDFVPEVIRDVQKYPETFALFYYHFPLSIHPASPTLIKAILVAEEKGVKDVVLKVYNEVFDLKTENEEFILKAFNKALKTNITVAEINKEAIVKRLNDDYAFAINLMINGTPTVYLNGKKDISKRQYREMIKEAK